MVEYDENYKKGLVVSQYEFDEQGDLRGATLVVGPNFDQPIGNEDDYPFGSTLRKRRERRVYVVGHEEHGHGMLAVEDPSYLEILREKEEFNR